MKKYAKLAARFAALSLGYGIVAAAVITAIFYPSFWTIALALVVSILGAGVMAKLAPIE